VARLLRLEGRIQPYAWGSPTRLYAFLGRPPEGTPAAELWLGTHPAGPATVAAPGGDRPLIDMTGPLPWLLKLLAIARPLSIQVHPTTRQARARAGATRSPDGRAKPELLVALEPTRALAGVRAPRRTLAAVAALGVPALLDAVAPLAAGDVAGTFRSLFTMPARARGRILGAALDAATAGRGGDAGELLLRLQSAHPDDPAILAVLLLEDVRLGPGEGLFIPPRMPHAYVEGFAVEIMAASDDVVRGGLTRKPVDVEAFLAVMDPRPHVPRIRRPAQDEQTPGVRRWSVPVAAFELIEVRVDGGPVALPLRGPAIALVLEGDATGRVDGSTAPALPLRAGEAAVALDGAARLELRGRGRIVVAQAGG
jgi:mannose-6-phosphate isomerase